MTQSLTAPPSPAAKLHRAAAGVPPLENGDRLDAAEFRRRYEAMGPGVRAELVGGIVYVDMASPVKLRRHGKPLARVLGVIIAYEARTPGIEYGTDSTTRLDEDNEYQPDAFVFLPEAAGGRARIDADDYIDGAPELVIEVANSSVNIDMNDKFEAYRRVGVREYVVWRVAERAIDLFALDGDRYRRQEPDDGVLKSGVFPGLWLDVAAMLQERTADVLDTLGRGIEAEKEAHAALVERLREASSREPDAAT